MNKETWKPVQGYEGLYEVSDMGRVRSLPKYNCKNVRLLKPTLNKRDGRFSVMLTKNLIHKRISVHRLVAKAFVNNPYPDIYFEVNHKDENPKNNKASNLEWCDRWYNMHYGTINQRVQAKQRRKPVKGINDAGEVIYFESMSEADRNGFCIKILEYIFKKDKRKKTNYYKGYYWERVYED